MRFLLIREHFSRNLYFLHFSIPRIPLVFHPEFCMKTRLIIRGKPYSARLHYSCESPHYKPPSTNKHRVFSHSLEITVIFRLFPAASMSPTTTVPHAYTRWCIRGLFLDKMFAIPHIPSYNCAVLTLLWVSWNRGAYNNHFRNIHHRFRSNGFSMHHWQLLTQ